MGFGDTRSRVAPDEPSAGIKLSKDLPATVLSRRDDLTVCVVGRLGGLQGRVGPAICEECVFPGEVVHRVLDQPTGEVVCICRDVGAADAASRILARQAVRALATHGVIAKGRARPCRIQSADKQAVDAIRVDRDSVTQRVIANLGRPHFEAQAVVFAFDGLANQAGGGGIGPLVSEGTAFAPDLSPLLVICPVEYLAYGARLGDDLIQCVVFECRCRVGRSNNRLVGRCIELAGLHPDDGLRSHPPHLVEAVLNLACETSREGIPDIGLRGVSLQRNACRERVGVPVFLHHQACRIALPQCHVPQRINLCCESASLVVVVPRGIAAAIRFRDHVAIGIVLLGTLDVFQTELEIARAGVDLAQQHVLDGLAQQTVICVIGVVDGACAARVDRRGLRAAGGWQRNCIVVGCFALPV